jgi:short-subunit dehydrogenase
MEHQDQSASAFAAVTGASSGIGLELAKQFARNGFDLMIVAEDEGIFDAAREIESLGAKVEAVQIDLADEDGVDEFYERIASYGAPLDAIAINAGVGVGGPFLENDIDDELNIIDLNVVSTVRLSKYVLRDMAARNEGRVLYTSSIAADAPGPFEAIYAASKAFVQSFAEAVRNELKDTGITVTSLQPGPTETNFFERAGMEDTKVGASKKDDPADVAKEGFDALMAGKDHVVAGAMKNKVQSTMSKVMPETTGAEMHRKQAEPGSANQ